MQWKKDPDKKYTELCVYIDAHIPDIVNHGEHPEIENTVYNYIWLVLKAIAIKKRMFQKFEDYDGYAFYGATRIYNALKKNYINQGKTIKGKLIAPIKSCLNYMKALLYPMKLEYQNETFNVVISEELTSKRFDSFMFSQSLKAHAQAAQNGTKLAYFWDTLETAPLLIDQVLKKSPFTKDSVEYHHLRISILLNCLRSLTARHKLDWDPTTIILWKLPKTLSSYVRILIREFYTELKKEIIDCGNIDNIPDAVLDKMISFPEEELYNNHEN